MVAQNAITVTIILSLDISSTVILVTTGVWFVMVGVVS
jgi:hypothetical protein